MSRCPPNPGSAAINLRIRRKLVRRNHGLPLAPCHIFPANAPAAFFSLYALKDGGFVPKLAAFIKTGKPVLLTDGLAQQLGGKVRLDAPNVHVLPVKGDPKSLLQLAQRELDDLRTPLLLPFKATLKAPNQVALYLFRDGSFRGRSGVSASG